MMKKCKICEITKELTEFSPAAKYKDKQYYRGECKECNRLEQQSDQTAQIKYRNSPNGKYKKWLFKQNPEYRNKQTQYSIDKYRTDPFFKAKKNIRRRLLAALYRKNWTKKFTFGEYIGCNAEEYIKHFESKFTEGMTWENQGEWHIDHIIPLSSAKTEEELYKLCHYTNLQPLWALDNIKKSNR
jgi:hypothetical protein